MHHEDGDHGARGDSVSRISFTDKTSFRGSTDSLHRLSASLVPMRTRSSTSTDDGAATCVWDMPSIPSDRRPIAHMTRPKTYAEGKLLATVPKIGPPQKSSTQDVEHVTLPSPCGGHTFAGAYKADLGKT